MKEVFLDARPPSDQRIDRLLAWIGVQPDGAEGIISMGPLPMITSKPYIAEMMRTPAQHAVDLQARAVGVHGKAELRVFVTEAEYTRMRLALVWLASAFDKLEPEAGETHENARKALHSARELIEKTEP